MIAIVFLSATDMSSPSLRYEEMACFSQEGWKLTAIISKKDITCEAIDDIKGFEADAPKGGVAALGGGLLELMGTRLEVNWPWPEAAEDDLGEDGAVSLEIVAWEPSEALTADDSLA